MTPQRHYNLTWTAGVPYIPPPPLPPACAGRGYATFTITAAPVGEGRHFYLDQTMKVRYNDTGAATNTDPVINW